MESNRPTPPDNLDGESLLEWQRVCDEMETAGTLDKKYRPLLILYVQTWGIAQRAMPYVEKLGEVIRCYGQPRPSPFLKVYQDASKQCHLLLQSLGVMVPKTAGGDRKDEPEELSLD